jgi:hypothetical protein
MKVGWQTSFARVNDENCGKPPVRMRKNDVCEVEIAGTGVLRNSIDERHDSSPLPMRHYRVARLRPEVSPISTSGFCQ